MVRQTTTADALAAGRPAGARAGLIWTLVRTDFKVRYHGTAGGFVWALLKPLTMFLMLMGVFSFLFGSDPNYKLDLIIGLFLWDFFAEGTKAGLTSLHARGFLLTKARCPAWILVITSISNAAITLTVSSVIILAFLFAVGRPPGPGAIALFLGYASALALLVAGFALGASVLFLRYRDLNQVWDMVVQAGFFVAPIIYPLGILPERYHIYLFAWAPTPVIEFSRTVLVDGGVPTMTAHGYLAMMVAISLAAGITIHRRFEAKAVECL